MKALDALKAERLECKKNLARGKPDPSLTRAIDTMLRYGYSRLSDMSLDELISKLSDPGFVMEIPNLGPKKAKRLIDHFKEPNLGGWG